MLSVYNTTGKISGEEVSSIENKLRSGNISFIDAFKTIKSKIGLDDKYIHVYVYVLDNHLDRIDGNWEIFLEPLLYIIKNTSSIAENNRQINDFLYYSNFEIFYSDKVLEHLLDIDIIEYDKIFIQRFLKYYVSHFNHNINIKKYNEYFQKILIHFVENKEPFLDELNIGFHTLLNLFGFSLKKAYGIIFDLIELGYTSSFVRSKEVGYINSIGIDELVKYLNEFDNILAYKVVHRLHNEIDFLKIVEEKELKDNMIYYISLLYETKLFSNKKDNDFLRFYLNLINKEIDSYLRSRLEVYELSNIINFIEKNEIDIFSNKEFIKFFLVSILSKVSFFSNIKDSLKSEYLYDLKNIKYILKTLEENDLLFKTQVYTNFIQLCINHLFVHITDSNIYKIVSDELILNIIISENISLDISFQVVTTQVDSLNRLSYISLKRLFDLLFHQIIINQDRRRLSKLIQAIIYECNSKVLYMTYRYRKDLRPIIEYDTKALVSKAWIHVLPPVGIYHFIRILSEVFVKSYR